MNKKQEWYARTTGGDSFNTAGKKSGVYPATISRAAAKGWKLSAETVIAIALGYGQNPVDALIACGFIPPMDGTHGVTLEQATNRQLLDEIEKRMK